MNLSIIIINWNSVKYLQKCLNSIYSNDNDNNYEIIVIDNASYDGSEELIMREFQKVKFIQSIENLGFAKANNLGFINSTGKNILFLNPDTEVMNNAIKIMLYNLETLENAGAVGCKLLNSDLSIQTDSLLSFPTILNQVLDFEYLKLQLPQLKLWGIKPLFLNSGYPEEVEVISGACLMVKRNVFKKIELFSTDYFMYSEEVDLCYKIKEKGYKVYYIGHASIIHHKGKSTTEIQKNYSSLIMMNESRIKFLRKTKGNAYVMAFRLITIIIAIFRLFLISGLLPFGIFLSNNRKLYFSFLKWKKILKWSIGMEKPLKDIP